MTDEWKFLLTSHSGSWKHEQKLANLFLDFPQKNCLVLITSTWILFTHLVLHSDLQRFLCPLHGHLLAEPGKELWRTAKNIPVSLRTEFPKGTSTSFGFSLLKSLHYSEYFIKIFSLNSLYFCSFSFTKLSLMKAQGKKILIFRVIWKRHHTVLILTSEGPLFTTCYSKGTMFLKFHVDFISFQVLESSMGFPGGSDGKESSYNVGNLDSIPGLGRFPWRRKWRPTLFLLEKSHGQKSRGVAKESDTT